MTQIMTPSIKRLLFPLAAPRWQRRAFWPVDVGCAAVAGYAEALHAVLTPSGGRHG